MNKHILCDYEESPLSRGNTILSLDRNMRDQITAERSDHPNNAPFSGLTIG